MPRTLLERIDAQRITLRRLSDAHLRGGAVAAYRFKDRRTTRTFTLDEYPRDQRETARADAAEARATGDVTGAISSLFAPKGRFLLSEWIPNSRLVRLDRRGRVLEVWDVPPREWKAIRETPDAALTRVWAEHAARPGFWPVFSGGGLGTQTIFRDSLEACVRAVRTALASNTWLQTEEPIRTARLAPRPETWTITLEAERALQASPFANRFAEGLALLDAAAPAHYEVNVSLEGAEWDDACLRVEVRDETRVYPYTGRAYTSLHLTTGVWGQRYSHRDFAMAREPMGEAMDRLLGWRVERFGDRPEAECAAEKVARGLD